MARKPAPAATSRPVLEWIMAGLGLFLTLAVIVMVARDGLGPPRPADLTVRLTELRPSASGWIAEVEVANSGTEAAAQVTVEARSGADTATATLDYVPGGGEERASLVLPSGPRPSPEPRVLGWSGP